MALIGVDEAGKGPVLGSMFAAAVRIEAADRLPAGIDDSKHLSPDRREELAATIRGREGIAVGLAEIPVDRIDAPGTDMNTLTVAAHADALRKVARPGDRVRLDAGDVDAERFGRRVRERLDVDVEIHPEHGADATHAVVGAASVLAKVARDAHVHTLGERYGELGSGYPSDPVTRTFLEEYVDAHGELPACARRSWQTSRELLETAEQTRLGGFGDDGGDTAGDGSPDGPTAR